MRPSSIILLLLLSSPALTAQTASPPTSAVFTAPPASASCPVSFAVKRSPNSGLLTVDHPNAPGAPLAQGLQIRFGAPPQSSIVKADITVHGMSGVHILPAASRAQNAADSTETFILTASTGSPLFGSSIWTKKLNSVTWLELTRLEYANGTIWRASADSRCTAAPSLLVLVGATAP